MKHATLNHWLANCAVSPGMLGCGVRLPDNACLTESASDKWPREHLDNTLPIFAGALAMLSNYGHAPCWLTWTFAGGQIRLVAHARGPLLALAAEPNTPAAQSLDQFTEEFLALDLAN